MVLLVAEILGALNTILEVPVAGKFLQFTLDTGFLMIASSFVSTFACESNGDIVYMRDVFSVCVISGNGQEVLTVDTDVECWTGAHIGYVFLSVYVIITYIPLAGFTIGKFVHFGSSDPSSKSSPLTYDAS